MVADLIFTKRDNTPWGFRLIGGADFEIPLTVTKVNEGSLAEQYGMLKGDVIVRINEAPTTNLTHFEAHELLVHAGNSFVLGVLRDKEVTPAGPAPEAPSVCSDKSTGSRSVSRNESRTSNHEVPQPVPTPPAITEQEQAQLTEIDKIVKDGPITDEEIAELISGEAEVLKNLNVIGVNFNRMMPKTMSLKTSAVFQTLNHEAMKTRQDLEEETKKWTTFLQKPDRPIPKPKELYDPNRPAPYQVKIVKQPKPRVAPDRVPTPPPREPTPIAEPEPETDYVDYIQDRTEETHQTEIAAAQEEARAVAEVAVTPEPIAAVAANVPEEEEEEEEEDEEEEAVVEVIDEGSSDPVLAKQLSDVQNQLLALSQLPNTIQATLAAITQQIAHLLPTPPAPVEVKEKGKKKKKKKDVVTAVETIPTKAKEPSPVKEKTPELIKVSPNELPIYEDHPGERDPVIISGDDMVNEADKPTTDAPKPESPMRLSREERELQRLEEEQRTHEEEWETKRQKEPAELKDDLQKELQQQLKDKPKQRPKSKQSFGGLTPQERPIFLPGGRKWRNPRDAYNEDFIAEDQTLELPMGGFEGFVQKGAQDLELCTVGGEIGQLINFLKYQKPEKDVSFIKNSETYKMIHHLDKEPESGIEARPEKVVAEEDLRRILNANFHLHHENQLDN